MAEKEHRFPTTRWSIVLEAKEENASQKLLSELFQEYWKPLYSYVRRSGWSREDAEDLTQEFLGQMLEKDHLAQVDPAAGKLRSFFLVYLRNFISDQRKAMGAQKRGGGVRPISLDGEAGEIFYEQLVGKELAPDEAFEQSWILFLLGEVMNELEEEYAQRGKREVFLALAPSLMPQGLAAGFREIAKRLGMREGAVKVAAYRLRAAYREKLHLRLRDTLQKGESVESELRYFAEVLSREV